MKVKFTGGALVLKEFHVNPQSVLYCQLKEYPKPGKSPLISSVRIFPLQATESLATVLPGVGAPEQGFVVFHPKRIIGRKDITIELLLLHIFIWLPQVNLVVPEPESISISVEAFTEVVELLKHVSITKLSVPFQVKGAMKENWFQPKKGVCVTGTVLATRFVVTQPDHKLDRDVV
ncbi:MAG: hypothetical protein RML37_04190 [Chitinophagales bacterium]|nr:hypothetical protein [Chitinophagales bacterium]